MPGADAVLLVACLAWTRRAFLPLLLSNLHGIGMLAVGVVCAVTQSTQVPADVGSAWHASPRYARLPPCAPMSRGGLLLGRHAHAETPWGLRPRVPYP